MIGTATAPANAANAANGEPKIKPNGVISISVQPLPFSVLRSRFFILHSNTMKNRERRMAAAKLFPPRQPMRQIPRQRHAQVRIRPQLHVVDILFSAAALQLGQE